MTRVFANNATSILDVQLAPQDVQLVVTSGHGGRFPSPATGEFFVLTLQYGNDVEIVHCTERLSDTMGVVRAQEGTTARMFPVGASVEMRVTAGTMGGMVQGPASMLSGHLLGRGSSGVGEAEPLSVGTGLQLAGGELRVSASVPLLSSGAVFAGPVGGVAATDVGHFLPQSQADGRFLRLVGGTVTGAVAFGSTVELAQAPTQASHAVPRSYVDAMVRFLAVRSFTASDTYVPTSGTRAIQAMVKGGGAGGAGTGAGGNGDTTSFGSLVSASGGLANGGGGRTATGASVVEPGMCGSGVFSGQGSVGGGRGGGHYAAGAPAANSGGGGGSTATASGNGGGEGCTAWLWYDANPGSVAVTVGAGGAAGSGGGQSGAAGLCVVVEYA